MTPMTLVAEPMEIDAGAKASGTERMCIVTRAVRPVAELIRFVLAPDGAVTPDLKLKLPGRGVWVTASRACVADAVKRGAFRRALKSEVRVRPDLADFVDQLLARAALDALAMAHKSGLVATGFGKVENALAHTNIVAVVHAAEASVDGMRKLQDAVRRSGGHAGLSVIRSFAQDQLDLALGRSNVVHAALLAGRASESVVARWQKLEHYRSDIAPQRRVASELGIE